MKVRRLTFHDGEEGQKRFVMIYRGFLEGGDRLAANNRQPKPLDTYRREAKLLNTMDKISAPIDGTPYRQWMNGDLELEEPDYVMVKDYFAAMGWTTVMSREVVDTYDWLCAIPQEDTGG